jgi:peptidoglycan/LPS O-acetylase OafA/YrhL
VEAAAKADPLTLTTVDAASVPAAAVSVSEKPMQDWGRNAVNVEKVAAAGKPVLLIPP